MCITGCFLELWETLFAGCGKNTLFFPQAVNRVFHGGIVSYTHFHDACIPTVCIVCIVIGNPNLLSITSKRNLQRQEYHIRH